jgi:hypothetical protein
MAKPLISTGAGLAAATGVASVASITRRAFSRRMSVYVLVGSNRFLLFVPVTWGRVFAV